MSKRLIYNISALVLGLALAGCSVLPEESIPDKGREIKFTATMGAFQVKATDVAFERGDAVGLFADSPINATNVRMTWDGNNFIPETSLFWAPGDEKRVSFQAYYPYSPDKTRGWEQFFVNADQSTHELFTQSDFMTATTAAGSPDGTVELQFRHRFSKIVIHIDQAMAGLDIADVYLGGVRGRVEGYVWGGYSVTGNPGTIKAGKAYTQEGEQVWALIIPSQDAKPQLMITTTDGKQYDYVPDYDIWFGAECRYNVYVTIDGGSIYTDFTTDVTGWTDNNDLAFPLPGTAKWSVTGTVHNLNWEKDLPMENCYSGEDVYYTMIYYREGDEFKLRKDGSWAVNLGIEGDFCLYGQNGVQDGPNITLPEEGVYEIFFCPQDKNYIYIQPLYLHNWGVTGSFENLNWDRDHYTDSYGRFYGDDGVEYPTLNFTVKAHAGDMFKVRFNHEWFMEYGFDDEWGGNSVLESGVMYQLRKGGPNMTFPYDGIYNVVFDFCNKRLFIEWIKELPVSAIKIDGDFSDWAKLDPGVVSVAYSAENPRLGALKMMKAYADEEAVFVYFEYDISQLTLEATPFQVFINSDNNTATGCSGHHKLVMWNDAGYEYLTERYIFWEGNLCDYYAPIYKWAGQDREEGWNWMSWADFGAAVGAGNYGAYEVRIDRYSMDLNDSFTLGINIESSDWQTLGYLPNGSVSENNPYGMGNMLPVRVGGPGTVIDGTTDSFTRTVIWENDGTHSEPYWDGTYDFCLEGTDYNGECIAAFSPEVWKKMKSNKFYVRIAAGEYFIFRVTTGWWDYDLYGDLYRDSERVINNGDGTYTIVVNYTNNKSFASEIDEKHLLLTGEGFTPLEIYYYN